MANVLSEINCNVCLINSIWLYSSHPLPLFLHTARLVGVFIALSPAPKCQLSCPTGRDWPTRQLGVAFCSFVCLVSLSSSLSVSSRLLFVFVLPLRSQQTLLWQRAVAVAEAESASASESEPERSLARARDRRWQLKDSLSILLSLSLWRQEPVSASICKLFSREKKKQKEQQTKTTKRIIKKEKTAKEKKRGGRRWRKNNFAVENLKFLAHLKFCSNWASHSAIRLENGQQQQQAQHQLSSATCTVKIRRCCCCCSSLMQ